MKNKLMILMTAGILAISGLVYGLNSNSNTCPLEGTADCPKIDCPLVGTPDCPYEKSAIPICCQ